MSNLNELYEEGKKNSLYLSLADGETFTGQYISVEKGVGQFGETKYYTFIVDGIEKKFNNKGFGFLQSMIKAGVEENDMVTITRHGEGRETRYSVQKITKK